MPSEPLSVIILAAGRGTRMRSARHKHLHEIAGLPIIDHVMNAVRGIEPTAIALVLAPGMEEVAAHAGDAAIFTQDEQNGTGGAVLAAREFITAAEGNVLILYGDMPLITRDTLHNVVNALKTEPKACMTVTTFQPDDPAPYGRVFLDNEGHVKSIVEAKDANADQLKNGRCNAGIYAVRADQVLGHLSAVTNENSTGELYLTDMVGVSVSRGEKCVPVEIPAHEALGVNDRIDLAAAEAIMQTRLRRRAMKAGVTMLDPDTVYLCQDTEFGEDVIICPSVVIGPGVRIGSGVIVNPFSHLSESVIERDAMIGPFARLRPETHIGEGARIGNFVEVKKAEVGAGAKISHLAYIGDARIGQNVNIGAGTITCNYDGFEKHFTDIADDAFIGSNTALVAPVKVGAGAYIGAGSVITADVSKNALAVTRAEQTEKKGWAKRFRAVMSKRSGK